MIDRLLQQYDVYTAFLVLCGGNERAIKGPYAALLNSYGQDPHTEKERVCVF